RSGELERALADVRRNAGKFEQHAARTHDGDPELRITFTGAHADFGRLLGDRLVGKHFDPDLTAALDVTRHCDTRRFDLTVGHPTRLERLKAPFAERQGAAAQRLAPHASA